MGEHARHAADSGGGVDADPHDARVGMSAPHECRMEHPRQLDVIDVPAVPAQEPGVLPPSHRRPEVLAAHHASRVTL